MDAASPKNTPKRKRGEEPWLSPIKFSFEPPNAGASDDGSSSPRSTVAHRFRGLALESGGGATPNDKDDEENVFEESLRKRQRPDDVMLDAPPENEPERPDEAPPALPLPLSIEKQPEQDEAKLAKPDAAAAAAGPLHRAYPSINRLADSKSRVKKRASSPPLRFKRFPRRPPGEDDDDVEIVDPVRAALTWHEDEITIYDPEDEDDDGTGINGIGFKPTPALAQARSIRRRQQMAEYRKREESEARSRRNQKRHGGAGIAIRSGSKSPSRKVRFMDAEAQNIVITTG